MRKGCKDQKEGEQHIKDDEKDVFEEEKTSKVITTARSPLKRPEETKRPYSLGGFFYSK